MSRAELRWAEQIAKEVIERERPLPRPSDGHEFVDDLDADEDESCIYCGAPAEDHASEIDTRENHELTEDDAFLEYADARADEIQEDEHVHVYVNVKLCRYCGRQPHFFYRTVEGVEVKGERL